MLNNLKNIISPIQEWLLLKGQCVGCGMPLSKGKKEKHDKELEKVTCKCGRIYLFDIITTRYKRALTTEV